MEEAEIAYVYECGKEFEPEEWDYLAMGYRPDLPRQQRKRLWDWQRSQPDLLGDAFLLPQPPQAVTWWHSSLILLLALERIVHEEGQVLVTAHIRGRRLRAAQQLGVFSCTQQALPQWAQVFLRQQCQQYQVAAPPIADQSLYKATILQSVRSLTVLTCSQRTLPSVLHLFRKHTLSMIGFREPKVHQPAAFQTPEDSQPPMQPETAAGPST